MFFSNWRHVKTNLYDIFNNFEAIISSKDGYQDIPNPFPDEITDLQDDRSYIGLIYADANRMGERLEQIESQKAYSYFSKIVKECNEEAIFTAIAQTIPPKVIQKTKIELLPFEIFLLGGDDIILAVPGMYALEVAQLYLDNFKQFTKNKLSHFQNGEDFKKPVFQNGISSAAGVVFAHGNYPLHLLLKYASELQKSAKKKSREMETQSGSQNGTEVNCIDFEIVKESLLPDLNNRRQSVPDQFTGKKLKLYKRPYSTEEIVELIKEVREWKRHSFPRNKLNEMYYLLHQGQKPAQIGFLKMLRRLPEEIQKRFILEFVLKNRFPWEKIDAANYSTPFLDLIEIYEFITE